MNRKTRKLVEGFIFGYTITSAIAWNIAIVCLAFYAALNPLNAHALEGPTDEWPKTTVADYEVAEAQRKAAGYALLAFIEKKGAPSTEAEGEELRTILENLENSIAIMGEYRGMHYVMINFECYARD